MTGIKDGSVIRHQICAHHLLILGLTLCLLTACSSTGHPGFPPQLSDRHCEQGDPSVAFPLKIKWCSELTWPISHPPKIQNGVAYVRTEDRLSGSKFYALDARTARVLWEYDTYLSDGAEPYYWAVADNSVVVGRDDELYGLNRLTGQLAWRKAIDNHIFQAMTTDGRRLYAAFSEKAYAIDPASGETLWEWFGLPSHYTFVAYYDSGHSTLVIPADHFYVLDAESGRLLYQSREEPWRTGTEAIPYHDQLIYGDEIVDVTTGKVEYELDTGTDSFVPAVISNTVYYITRDWQQVASWDLDVRRLNWVYSAGPRREFLSNFVILGHYGYILADDDTLRAVSLASGQEVGRWSGPQSSNTLRDDPFDTIPSPGLVASNDVLYLSFGTNLLYTFEER